MSDRISKVLNYGSWIPTNAILVRKLNGVLESYVMGYLINRYEYFKTNKLLIDKEWFYCKREDIEKFALINDKAQRKMFAKFYDMGLLEYKDQGLPMKRYYRINFKKLEELMFEEED